MKAFVPTFVIVLLAIVVGCELTPEQKSQVQTQLDTLKQERNATTQAIAQTQEQLKQIPDNDPQKAQVAALLAKLQDNVVKFDKLIAGGQLVLTNPTPSNPGLDAVALSAGPWGILGLAVLRLGWTEYDRWRKTNAITQTVKALDQSPLTPEQKLALEAKQDVSTKALVTKITG